MPAPAPTQTPNRYGGRRKIRTHAAAVTAMLSAVAFILMFLDFPIPFLIPGFVKMDFSELPALLAAFSLGPACGAAVCLVKNLIHLSISQTGFSGELCNFLLGAFFVLPAGLIYQRFKSRRGALIGALTGAAIMGLLSIPLNYYITYPIYAKIYPIETILALYQKLRPSVNGLLECLIVFNAPFTFIKGLLTTALCFAVYKPLSPVLHGTWRK